MAIFNIAAFRRGKKQDLSTQESHSQGRPRRLRRGGIASIAVLALAGGLVATGALPAHGFTPDSRQVATVTVAPGGFTAPVVAVATSSATSIGAVPIRTFPITAVFAVAARYQGVPYVFGGASPRGFDCSGLIKYVWAKFGKRLPHSARAQAAMGRRISRAAAKPGDLVVLPGHIGFYAGNGRILHAPYPGKRVRIQRIWTNNYYIVRL